MFKLLRKHFEMKQGDAINYVLSIKSTFSIMEIQL